MQPIVDQFRLDGRVALVTGGARGLGHAIAGTLVAAGAVVAISDIAEKEGTALASELGDSAIFVRHDVTSEADWEAAIASTISRFGGIDVVVNNAGIESAALFADCTLEEFNRTMSVNASSVFLGIKHGIRAMRPGGASGRGGSIVNMSSAAGLKGTMGLGAYCGSKGAVRLMTKSAAVECAMLKYNIRVNSVHPGLIKTDMGIKTLEDYVRLGLMPDLPSAEKAFASKHLLGFGAPQDIANGVRYLASDASRWVTGTELTIDGGLMAG